MTNRFPYFQYPILIAFVLLALLLVPAPLLPPHRLARAVERTLGIGWKPAYLASTVGLSACFYFTVGLASVIAVGRAEKRKNRLLQIFVLPLAVIGVAFLIRLAAYGYLPMFANVAVPLAACALGVWIGMAFVFRKIGWNLVVVCAVLGGSLWLFSSHVSADLARMTESKLKKIGEAAPTLPAEDERFGAILRIVFEASGDDPVLENRAAILALGIAVGQERVARFVGLDRNSETVKAAVAAANGTTLRKRQDWAKHFSVSAAIVVLESPLVSDVGGLIKEEMDMNAKGSGFSFDDLAADRAGIRFAEAATGSESSAKMVKERTGGGFATEDYLPPIEDLPTGLTPADFASRFGGAGSAAFRKVVADIDARLNGCKGLK